MNSKKLYLDDIRDPPDESWIVVRTYSDFIKWIETNGLPKFISFDHDLGEEKTGYDAVKWMCNWIMDRMDSGTSLELPEIIVHSANPVGRENIIKYWESFVRAFQK